MIKTYALILSECETEEEIDKIMDEIKKKQKKGKFALEDVRYLAEIARQRRADCSKQ